MDKTTIIALKMRGMSDRAVSRQTGINRKTVARYWDEYQAQISRIMTDGDNRMIQEAITAPPRYNTSSRKRTKYTDEIDRAIDAILADEAEKARLLGDRHKQKLTNRQIHSLLKEQGHDIGLTTVTVSLQEKRGKTAEAFIRQEYDFGERLEFDFGEVRLVIGGVARKYYLAVFGSPAASFWWAYLYDNQKKPVFLDAHVRFFEMVGGVYGEVVYDNMKNVVSAFIGPNEKELNPDLIAMSMYYGFRSNVTNCYSGNEKGYVESGVKNIRKEVFAVRYRFDSTEEAEEYLEKELICMNSGSRIDEEGKHLMPYRAPLELSRMTTQKVDKYSFIRVENNFYSVPEHLVGREVTVRNYLKDIVVYAGLDEVCRHRKKTGYREISVILFHYLDTLRKKPGALRNAAALKSEAGLKAVFDRHYTSRPRDFIDAVREYADRPVDEIVRLLEARDSGSPPRPRDAVGSNVLKHTRDQLRRTSAFFTKGGVAHGD